MREAINYAYYLATDPVTATTIALCVVVCVTWAATRLLAGGGP